MNFRMSYTSCAGWKVLKAGPRVSSLLTLSWVRTRGHLGVTVIMVVTGFLIPNQALCGERVQGIDKP